MIYTYILFNLFIYIFNLLFLVVIMYSDNFSISPLQERYKDYCKKRKIKCTNVSYFNSIIQEKCKIFAKRFEVVLKEQIKVNQQAVKEASKRNISTSPKDRQGEKNNVVNDKKDGSSEENNIRKASASKKKTKIKDDHVIDFTKDDESEDNNIKKPSASKKKTKTVAHIKNDEKINDYDEQMLRQMQALQRIEYLEQQIKLNNQQKQQYSNTFEPIQNHSMHSGNYSVHSSPLTSVHSSSPLTSVHYNTNGPPTMHCNDRGPSMHYNNISQSSSQSFSPNNNNNNFNVTYSDSPASNYYDHYGAVTHYEDYNSDHQPQHYQYQQRPNFPPQRSQNNIPPQRPPNIPRPPPPPPTPPHAGKSWHYY